MSGSTSCSGSFSAKSSNSASTSCSKESSAKKTKKSEHCTSQYYSRCQKRSNSCSSSQSPFNPIAACCGPPPQPPMIYRPDRCCYERVQGPFKNPIPTKYQRCVDKFKQKCCRSNPARVICCEPAPRLCCDDIRQYKACCAELQRLREERCREEECRKILAEKCRQERMEQQYQCELQEWEKKQAKCERDRERRKVLLKQILCHRKEMKQLKEEARMWRRYQQDLLVKQQREKEEMWVQEYSQREDERRWEQEKLRMCQENRLLDSQMRDRDSKEMACPELEELRRMFCPVEHGPKETFEYFLLEPRQTDEEIRKETEQKVMCLMGLRNEHGIHLNLADRAQKRTTIQLAMGPKHSDGDREQTCNIISTPGALCSACADDSPPNVLIPQCLKPLMQTLTYRVNEIDSPLLSMKSFECGEDGARTNGKEVQLESGPNFNGNRLYGTIVLPKGKALSPFYTQPYAVSF